MSLFDSVPCSLVAAADLSASQWCFGKATSTGIAVCNTAGERADCVIGNEPNAAGQAVDGFLERIFKVKVGVGGVTDGDALTTDTDGTAITAGAAQCINAIALETGVAGQLIAAMRPLGLALPPGFGGAGVVTTGAIPVDARLTELSVTGTVAYTLANGTDAGQVKTIECTVAATSPVGTLTIATPFSGEAAVYVFHAVGQAITLCWDGTAWKLIAKKRAGSLTVVVGTTVLTGYLLTETYSLSVTGTVHSTTTKGVPAPQIAGEYIRVMTAVATGTPLGDIAIAGFTAALVAATSLAGINATTCAATFHSNGVSWDLGAVTTATYS